jgi:hypothetical protein
MATVPGNALQDHMRNQQKVIKRPSFGMRGTRRGILIKVYDRDTLDGAEVPGELARAIARRPGRLYGQVKLPGGEMLYLPFLLSPEIIYSVYGDSKLIEGRAVNVVFYDRNIHLGEIDLIPQENMSLRDTKNTTNVFDIGGIF